MSKRVADVLVETLQAAGVKRCYGIVGDTLNRIAHAIHESDIEWVHMRHEEAGAFAASAEGQFTGKAHGSAHLEELCRLAVSTKRAAKAQRLLPGAKRPKTATDSMLE